MTRISRKTLPERKREILVVMTALAFVKDSELMSDGEVRNAKRLIQSILGSSHDNEMLLPVLIDHIKTNRRLREEFTEVSRVNERIARSVSILDEKFSYLNDYLASLNVTSEERDEFIDPFMQFARRFHARVIRFEQDMRRYLELREREAERERDYRAAEEASQNLKIRLSSMTDPRTGRAGRVIDDPPTVGTFNYEETEGRLLAARKECAAMSRTINSLLADLKSMCQMAMNPDMRDTAAADRAEDLDCEDVFDHFSSSLKSCPRMAGIKAFVIDYFRLFQRAYHLLHVDYENFERAVGYLSESPGQYFDVKGEHKIPGRGQQKLRAYDGLIPFLETAQDIVDRPGQGGRGGWSDRFALLIESKAAPWSPLSAQLNEAKTAAEHELRENLGA